MKLARSGWSHQAMSALPSLIPPLYSLCVTGVYATARQKATAERVSHTQKSDR